MVTLSGDFTVLLAVLGRSGTIVVPSGGKGGVGKTTWAAALAVRFGRSGLRRCLDSAIVERVNVSGTLCVSTDPAHSLADALQVKLKGEPTMVEVI